MILMELRKEDIELAKTFLKGEWPDFADNQLFLELVNTQFMDELYELEDDHHPYVERVVIQAQLELNNE